MTRDENDPYLNDGLLTEEELALLWTSTDLCGLAGMRSGQRVLGRLNSKRRDKLLFACLSIYEAKSQRVHQDALGALRLALRLMPRVRERDADRANLLSNCGLTLDQLRRHEEAFGFHERAWAMHRDKPHLANNPDLTVSRLRALLNFSVNLHCLRKYPQACELLSEELLQHSEKPHASDKSELHILIAKLHSNLAASLSSLGKTEPAEKSSAKALRLMSQSHLADHLIIDIGGAGLLMNVAVNFGCQGKADDADRIYEWLLKLLSTPPFADDPQFDLFRLGLLNNYANNLVTLEKRHEASDYYERGRTLSQHKPQNPDDSDFAIQRVVLLIAYADNLYALGEHEPAFERLKEALADLRSVSMRTTRWFGVAGVLASALCKIVAGERRPEAIEAVGELSDLALEALDFQYGNYLARARDSFAAIQRVYLRLCLEQDRAVGFPEILRRIQGRKCGALILDGLAPSDRVDDKTRALLEVRKTLRRLALEDNRRPDTLLSEAHPPVGKTVEALAAEAQAQRDLYRELLDRYRILHRELERDGRLPDTQALPTDLGTLQRGLRTDEALVLALRIEAGGQAVPAEAGSASEIVLVVRSDSARFASVQDLGALGHATVAYGDSCPHGDWRKTLTNEPTQPHSATAPSLADLRARLQSAFWKPLAPYLEGVTRVTVLPHGDALHTVPFELGAPEGVALRFYPGLVFYGQARARAAAATPGPTPEAPIGVRVHPAPETGKPLPFVNAEAHLVAAVWGKGSVVDPADLGTRTPPLRAYHAAGHGRVDSDLGSAHLLTGADERLDLHTVLAAPQQPEVVFLSACVVGRLQEDFDGDPLGLVSAFLLKGARYVIAPLIPVPDFYMPLLAFLFHREWRSGRSPDAALAEAKRCLYQADWGPDTAEQAAAAYYAVLRKQCDWLTAQNVLNLRLTPAAVAAYLSNTDVLAFVRGFGDG